jgi:hypothetical protein
LQWCTGWATTPSVLQRHTLCTREWYSVPVGYAADAQPCPCVGVWPSRMVPQAAGCMGSAAAAPQAVSVV